MKQQLSDALAFAAMCHKGQFDKGGFPYILHPIRVMQLLDTEDQELMAIAVLHDVVEDCGITFDDLRKTMSERVVLGVDALTKRPGETVNQNIIRIRNNPDARQVKLADLQHNMDPQRLKGMREKDMLRMNKYVYMYYMLTTGSEEFNSLYGSVK